MSNLAEQTEQFFALIPRPELQCVVCSKYYNIQILKFPCDCARPIHTHCINIWKQHGGLCTQCGKEWNIPRSKIRCENLKWAGFCMFILCLGCVLLWLLIHFIIQVK